MSRESDRNDEDRPKSVHPSVGGPPTGALALAESAPSRSALLEAGSSFAASHTPRRGERLLMTERGSYYRTEILRLEFNGGASVAPFLCLKYPDIDPGGELDFATAVQRIDADMHHAGLEVVGDLCGDRIGSGALRGYAMPDGTTFALLSVVPLAAGFEFAFYSRLPDGRWVVTSSAHEPDDIPKPAGTSRQEEKNTSAIDLARMHRVHLERAARGAVPLPAPADLTALAALIDAYLAARVQPATAAA